MFDLVKDIFGTSLGVVELVGKAVEVVGEATNSETLQDIGKLISDNAEIISK